LGCLVSVDFFSQVDHWPLPGRFFPIDWLTVLICIHFQLTNLMIQLTLSYWRRTPVQNGLAVAGGRRHRE
jgi:hypothetical protein